MTDPKTTPAAGTDRRSFVVAGAGLAAATVGYFATGREATAAPGQAVPNLYPNLNARNFTQILTDEATHVSFIVDQLGAMARPKPNFRNLEQPNVAAFVNVAKALENTGSGAYTGAAPAIFNKTFLGYAVSVALIEARHSGYLNTLLNDISTVNVLGDAAIFEQGLTQQQVINLAGPFIADLNGGPPLAFNATPSRTNDVAIFNFALALEYLEAEFYAINVPKFFPS